MFYFTKKERAIRCFHFTNLLFFSLKQNYERVSMYRLYSAVYIFQKNETLDENNNFQFHLKQIYFIYFLYRTRLTKLSMSSFVNSITGQDLEREKSVFNFVVSVLFSSFLSSTFKLFCFLYFLTYFLNSCLQSICSFSSLSFLF